MAGTFSEPSPYVCTVPHAESTREGLLSRQKPRGNDAGLRERIQRAAVAFPSRVAGMLRDAQVQGHVAGWARGEGGAG